MNKELKLRNFIRGVRRRLWLSIVSEQLLQGLKVGVGLLLINGILHFYAYHLPLWIVLFTSFAPIGYKFGLALSKKPDLIAAANVADRLLAAKSLLTTAAGLLFGKQPVPTGYSALIIRQAEQSVSTWQKQLAQQPIRPVKIGCRATPVIALLGIFLLFQPAGTDRVFNETGKTPASSQYSAPMLQNPLLKAVKKQLSSAEADRNALSEKLIPNTEPTPPPGNSFRPVADAAQTPSPAGDQLTQSLHADQQASTGKSRPGIGNEAGLQPLKNHQIKNPQPAVKLIETGLNAGDPISNAKAGVNISDARLPNIQYADKPSTLPAQPIAQLTANMSFSQQHYVANFFKQSHQTQ